MLSLNICFINSSITSEDIIDIELINIVEKVAYDERHKIIKQISEELKDAAKSIAWSLVVNTYEDMFIELEEYNGYINWVENRKVYKEDSLIPSYFFIDYVLNILVN